MDCVGCQLRELVGAKGGIELGLYAPALRLMGMALLPLSVILTGPLAE